MFVMLWELDLILGRNILMPILIITPHNFGHTTTTNCKIQKVALYHEMGHEA
jgi:hypothetical protein